jgi:hypothetical protein
VFADAARARFGSTVSPAAMGRTITTTMIITTMIITTMIITTGTI